MDANHAMAVRPDRVEKLKAGIKFFHSKKSNTKGGIQNLGAWVNAFPIGPPRANPALPMWPTPTVQDSKNNGAPSQMDRNTKPLNAEVGEPLNPTWVEWLMNWPMGWTSLLMLPRENFDAFFSPAWWETEPLNIPRTSNNTPDRVARLRCIGNGQVPSVVKLAWEILA